MSAVTRSYVRSPVATDNRQIGITSQLYQVSSTRKRLNRCTKLGSHANLDMAHQLNDVFRTECAYTTINTQGNVPAAKTKGMIPNTFK